jgi:hypothetical protein
MNRSSHQVDNVCRSFAASAQLRAAEGARVGDHSENRDDDMHLITTEDELHRAMALQSAACNWDKVIELFQESEFEPDKVTLQLAVAGEITVVVMIDVCMFNAYQFVCLFDVMSLLQPMRTWASGTLLLRCCNQC